jgi:hypothetical protein
MIVFNLIAVVLFALSGRKLARSSPGASSVTHALSGWHMAEVFDDPTSPCSALARVARDIGMPAGSLSRTEDPQEDDGHRRVGRAQTAIEAMARKMARKIMTC